MRTGTERLPANGKTGQAVQEESVVDEFFLPPRGLVHKSEKEKWTRLFFSLLLGSFVLLIVAVIGWFLWHEGYRLPF